jgi:ABC-type lipoprotein export system ATPase subunit
VTVATDRRSLLSLSGVGFEVSSPAPLRILHPLDLDVRAGSTVAIVGPSGAGKSTLASILGALQPPTEGTYRFDGDDVTTKSGPQAARLRRDRIGFVFQNALLIDERNAWQNVALGLDPAKTPRRLREELSREALAAVGLSHVADRLSANLSGGERQRVAVARALAKRPQLIIADEPTGSLDQRTGELILDLLLALATTDTTLIIVTHDLRAADRTERVVAIVDGRLQ